MKAYFSYWSEGYRTPNDFILDLTKLSAYFAKKAYGEAHLITDSKSYSVFKNIFNWDSISKDLDVLPVEYKEIWSLGKIKAFEIASQKKEHFVHIDSDVILWEKLPKFIEDADIFCQSREGHVTEWPSVNKIYSLPNKYYIKDKIKPYISPNCGIFGGKDWNFINKYSSTALKLVFDKKNKDFWINEQTHHFEKAVLAEQYYLAICAEIFKKDIVYLLETGSDEECQEKKYTHLLGAKNDPIMPYKIKEAVKKIGLN